MGEIEYVKTKDIYFEKITLKKPQATMHYHNAYELYYILEGEREYFVGDKFFLVNERDMVLIPSGMLHRTSGKGATRILGYFSYDFLSHYLGEQVLSLVLPDEPFVFHANEADEHCFDIMINSVLDQYAVPKEDDENVSLKLAAMVFSILLFAKTQNNTYIHQKYANKHLEQVVRYINENYARLTSIEDIAEENFISKHHLCHIFKEYLGVSIITYLNKLKIREACRLIRETDLHGLDLAYLSGFNSYPYFSKVFKDEMGFSPMEYEKSLRKTKSDTNKRL